MPPSGPVTVTATSIAFPTVSASSAPVTIQPSTALSINFVPFAPAQVTTASTINLTAAVRNDPTNAGVDWQVCGNGCGFFTTQAAIAEIPATPTTPLVPAVPAVTATTVQGWPNGLAIPYTAPETVPRGGNVAIAATAHANTGFTVAANVTVTTAITGPSITGTVLAGVVPVAGAEVSLYAAGVSGYGSKSIPLVAPNAPSSATTAADGSFTVTGGYSCPPNSQVYLVALGGAVGTNAANPNLAMMTALGPCSNLGATPVVINEVTTVASVWPLAPFSTNQPVTGLLGYQYVGSSAANAIGLAHAFATVNNLVDVTTGQPLYFVPVGNAAVPYVEINTLADVLNSCTASVGGQYNDGSACGNLFKATAPLVGQAPLSSLHSAPPTDTIQAAFNAAQHPTGSFGYQIVPAGLFTPVTSESPFQPILTSPLVDLSISLHYTNVAGLTSSSGASSFAIDGTGNVWLSATNQDRIVEVNSVGATLSPSGGYTAGGIKAPGPIAIDSSNDIWIANSDSLSELYNNGVAVEGSPFYGVTNGLDMAIDGLNNIWITNPGGVTDYNSVGTELSPVGGYSNDGITGISAIAIAPGNNIWVGYQLDNGFRLAELTDANGQLFIDASVPETPNRTQIVADGSGNIWSTPANSLCRLPPYRGGDITLYIASCTAGGNSPSGSNPLPTVTNSAGIALDGAGDLWIANAGAQVASGDVGVVAANVTEIMPAQLTGTTPGFAGLLSPSLAVGTKEAAVDGSGNVWVLLSDSSLTEYVGVAVPAITPIATGLRAGRLGRTP